MPVLTTRGAICSWHLRHGWVTTEHRQACNEPDCRGCRTCPEDHCELDGHCPNHVDHDAGIYTCPRCIGKVRTNVHNIRRRYADLPAEAVIDGVESEALSLHGPAAYPGQWTERRRRLVQTYTDRGWCDYPKHDALTEDDPHHPLAVLGRWDMTCRDAYGPTTDLFVNVRTAADYLTGPLLDTFAHTNEFQDFATDVARCLGHLEAVLSDSRTPELGAPCPTCRENGERAPRLVKHYAKHTNLKPREICTAINCHCDNDTPGHCRICAGHDDTWHCPTPAGHWWADADYRARIDGDYLQHATTLTASQIHAAHGIKPGTLRQWALRGHVAKRGRNQAGQQLYDVTQAKAMTTTDQASA